jgi:hypothetical protein
MENTTPTLPALPQVPGAKKEKYIISGIIFILAVVVAYLAWYVNGKKQVAPAPEPLPVTAPLAVEPAPPVPSPEEEASLGGDIYKQTEDPIKDKIPEGVAPVSNPIGGAYKNPFQ